MWLNGIFEGGILRILTRETGCLERRLGGVWCIIRVVEADNGGDSVGSAATETIPTGADVEVEVFYFFDV